MQIQVDGGGHRPWLMGIGEAHCMRAMFGDLGVLRVSMQISKEIIYFRKKICIELRVKTCLQFETEGTKSSFYTILVF